MIGIKLDDQLEYLDVKDDTVIEIQLSNPILGDSDKISPGSSSLPFSLPGGEVSPKNSVQLKDPDIIENSEVYQPQNATLSWNRVDFRKGQIKVDGVENDTIDSYLLFGLSTLTADIKTKKLRDLIDENIILDDTPIAKKVFLTVNAVDYTIEVTVNGKKYQVDEDTPVSIQQQILNDAVSDVDDYVPIAILDPAKPVDGIGNYGMIIFMGKVISPGNYLYSTDPLISLSVEIAITAFIYKYQVTSDLSNYWNGLTAGLTPFYDGTYSDKILFPRIYNLFIHVGIPRDPILNKYTVAGGHNVPLFYDNKLFYPIQPFIRMTYLLTKISEYIGIPLAGDFYDYADSMLIDNNYPLSDVQKFDNRNYMFVQRSFNCKDLIPDLTVIDFLKAFMLRYNLAIYQHNVSNKLLMQFREPIALSNNYENIDSISSRKGKITDERIAGYSLSIAKEPNDDMSTDELVTVGTPEDVIEITCGCLHQNYVMSPSNYVVPVVQRAKGTDWGLRIFHFKIYPGAPKTIAAASYKLEPPYSQEDLVSIHERYHKYWMLFFKNKRSVSLLVNWTFNQIRRFDWTLKRRFNRSAFLVDSITIQLSKSFFKVTEVILRTQK